MSFIDCVVSNVAIATLFALLASFAGRVTEKPQIKHTLWVLVLVKLVTTPLVHLPVSFIVSAPLAVESGGGQTGTTMVVQPVDTMEERSAFRPDVEYSTTAADSVQLSTAETVYDAETVATGRVQRIFFAAMPWVKALVCVWVVGSLIWFLLATTRLLRFRKVLHYAYAASEDVHAEVTAIAAKYGLQSIPRVLVADAVIPPLVWCLGRRATLVLPRGLLCRLGAEERAGLLAHELAHIKRFDHWIRWLEFVVLGVYWWNPLAWWARTQVQQSEEECCDAWVLWTFPERACLYARTLMQTVDFLAGSPEVKPGIVTAFCQGDSLKRRVELIVSASGSRRLLWPYKVGLALFAVTATPMAFSARLDEQDEQSLSHAPITVFEEKVAGGDSRGQQGIAGLKDAIDPATRYLRSKQRANGSWEDFQMQPGGTTALCTLALLRSHLPANDECVLRALEHLREQKQPEMVYSAALQLLVFCAADSQSDRRRIEDLARWLQEVQVTQSSLVHRVGSWAYGKGRGGGDNSNTRFAAIALAEAERRGVDVDPDVWKRLRDYLLDSQNEDGSWGYHPRQAGYGSMTCGAIASLAASSKNCTDEAEKSRCVAAIDAGWRWLEDCFTTRENPGAKPVWVHYYLESLARAATATKKTKIAGHDWRQEGTTTLLSWQDGETGMWKGDDIANRDPVIDTSFALLFLAESSLPDLNIFQGEMQTTGENRNSLSYGKSAAAAEPDTAERGDDLASSAQSIDARDTSLAASSEKQATGVAVVGRVVRDGRPVSGFHVGLRRASPPQTGDKYYRFDLLDESITDRAGRYRLTGLRKDDMYFLEVEMQDDAEVRGWDYQFGVSHTVRVEGQATIELPDAVLMVNNQTLSGVVVDSDGIPVEGIMVDASLASGARLSRPQNGPPPWTLTDDQGRFTLSYLPDAPIALMAYRASPSGGPIVSRILVRPDLNARNIRILFAPHPPETPGHSDADEDRPALEETRRPQEPVLMVQVKCGGSLGCFPVSRDGVLLPPDHFSSTDTRKYLNAKLGNFGPIGAVGSKYGYTAVTEAAGIAALLKDVWKKARVKCIAIQGSSVSEPQVYVLLPAANGIEVIWGHAPGSENEGEATASEKVKRLAEFARHNREETTFLPLPTTTLDLRPANGALLRDGTE